MAQQKLDEFNPVGTPEELEELKLDTGIYRACRKSAPGAHGCPYWERCTMPFKGKPGAAPENLGVYREVSQAQAVKVMAMPCFRYYFHQQGWKDSGDTFTIIGYAGDMMVVHETYEDATERVTQMGKPLPVCKHQDIKREIPKFQRPAEVLSHRMAANKIREQLRELEEQKIKQQLLGEAKDGEPAKAGGGKRSG